MAEKTQKNGKEAFLKDWLNKEMEEFQKYLTSAVRTKEGSLVLTTEVKYSSRKIALKTARDGEKNMTHDSVNIFFKLLLKNLL